ncbi:MAG: ABC transporter ATP-binding protein [Spirochaetales bacterium]|nr:ABC transporter ATP-binding protein [Spirochaetales bacterium]MDD6841945.1 ABC transporter ATP-binding protein [Spirochaetales bacterium]
MSIKITINHALKKYGDFVAIPDLSLEIKPGEFFTLLGPSGCGKTTLLRMIAGFNSIEGGEFYFGDRLINDLDPSKRNIGMVFQNYAIFPHLTVRKNVAFGLQNRKLPKEEIKEKTDKFMELMKIKEYADRLPEKLSGGQQQRVALARALAIEPEVLLMDEPLSNLDAKLRVEMRTVIKEIQNRLGITTVYVTHDQEEAMAVSDRIAVMNQGVIQQIGSPKALYQRPANSFVATFIGRTNMMKAKVWVEGNRKGIIFDEGYKLEMKNLVNVSDGQEVKVSVRPEELVIEGVGEDKNANYLSGKVQYSTFLGLNTHYIVELEDGYRAEIIQESLIDDIIENGTVIRLGMKAEKINVFTSDGSESLVK